MKKFGPARILETKYLYCNKHGETEFVYSGIKIKKWKCCKCTIEYSRKYRLKQKIRAVEYLGGKCILCGYSKSISALSFHHKNHLFKEYNLSGTAVCKRWDKLKIELDKCELVCMNCHLEIHAREDFDRIESEKKIPTSYHNKLIHRINSKKLGKKPSL